MEMSLDMPNLDHQFNAPIRTRQIPDVFFQKSFGSLDNETIDLEQIQFEDDENWLCESSNQTVDLTKWLYSSNNLQDDVASDLPQIRDFKSEVQKTVDSRTFTRPKKRYNRPSIEKYNEEIYGNEPTKTLSDSGVQINSSSTELSQPNLIFDLAQPTNSHYFENILANAPMLDSFINMSPPSLVNSMCSSTFANLMENSFIKNDPVLREIRDTDYTESILLQDTEPMMFQSITGSCSSLNSDVPENFLKKMSFNETLTNHQEEENEPSTKIDITFEKKPDEQQNIHIDDDLESENFKENKIENFNGTYQRKSKTKTTFRMSDVTNGTININHTFQRRKNKSLTPLINTTMTLPLEQNLNTTYARELCTNELVETKRLLDRRPMPPSLDLNRLSYLVDEKSQEAINATYDNKRNSFGSTDSADNIDYMSVSSGSSKSSTKILSMDGLNHIVEMQERSLGQVMSTPKPNSKTTRLWENNVISPISGRNSDPELSSSEKFEFKQPLLIGSSQITKQKSLGQINAKLVQPKIMNSLSKLQHVRTNIRGSQPNLKTMEVKNIQKSPPQSQLTASTAAAASRTNLNSMGRTLKGSYTSLRPTNTNLPVAPPLDSTITVPRTVNVTQILKQPSPPPPPQNNEGNFARPQRTSGLPRPVSAAGGTGIPRPVSRIPGPRNVRSIQKPMGQQSSRQTNYY